MQQNTLTAKQKVTKSSRNTDQQEKGQQAGPASHMVTKATCFCSCLVQVSETTAPAELHTWSSNEVHSWVLCKIPQQSNKNRKHGNRVPSLKNRNLKKSCYLFPKLIYTFNAMQSKDVKTGGHRFYRFDKVSGKRECQAWLSVLAGRIRPSSCLQPAPHQLFNKSRKLNRPEQKNPQINVLLQSHREKQIFLNKQFQTKEIFVWKQKLKFDPHIHLSTPRHQLQVDYRAKYEQQNHEACGEECRNICASFAVGKSL